MGDLSASCAPSLTKARTCPRAKWNILVHFWPYALLDATINSHSWVRESLGTKESRLILDLLCPHPGALSDDAVLRLSDVCRVHRA